MDKLIKQYINKQPSSQKEICLNLRNLIIKTIPGIEEELKWGVLTYGNGKFYIVGLKKDVNMGFAIKGLSKLELTQFSGKGKNMRHLKINNLKNIKEKEIAKLIKLVYKKAKCTC